MVVSSGFDLSFRAPFRSCLRARPGSLWFQEVQSFDVPLLWGAVSSSIEFHVTDPPLEDREYDVVSRLPTQRSTEWLRNGPGSPARDEVHQQCSRRCLLDGVLAFCNVPRFQRRSIGLCVCEKPLCTDCNRRTFMTTQMSVGRPSPAKGTRRSYRNRSARLAG